MPFQIKCPHCNGKDYEAVERYATDKGLQELCVCYHCDKEFYINFDFAGATKTREVTE